MHADIWSNKLWEYEKGNKDMKRKKLKVNLIMEKC